MATALVLPSWFFTSLAAAIATQIATTAVAIAENALWLLVAGLAVFVAVAAAQLLRFRRINGAWLGGLASRVVLGTASAASIAYAAALAGGVWAAYGARWGLVAICSLAGGGAYALSGRRWMRSYRADPSAQARGESPAQLAVLAAVAVICVAGLLLGR